MSTTLFALLALAAALQTAGTSPPQSAGSPPPSSSYRIGAQDQLLITVADEAELSGKFRVDNDGSFIFPYLGRVAAAGKTLAELQAALTRDLSNGYLRNPQVRVEVDQYKSQSVFVSGEVRSPGKITMVGSTMTLLDALGQAGSPTPTASTEIVITRRGADPNAMPDEIRVNRRDVETGRAAQDLYLRDGDVIFVPKTETFYISGLVRNPGSYVLDPGMTVEQALALAGGLTDRGSDRGIVITRVVNGVGVDRGVNKLEKVQAGDTIKVRGRFF
jgi:polysaccharide export outer membrane protein